ncbi:MAG: type II toxin-antitoxin system CcdA family antitoxin [Sulfuricella sp.]|jgi:antitoxin CcdA|nr:type II toxin-antitoxin system CcdA family antitoxin [Sulfuricella sp.]
MHRDFYDSTAKKKSANLSINESLLRQAKALNINLSQLLEQRLAEYLRESLRENWLAENRGAIDAYNQRIERNGVFSDGLRTF